jgi:alpha-D-xyloside xylohydrolase
MFRSHGTDTPREVWRFGEPGTPFYDTLVKFIRLRYRLLPYIYSLAGWVTHNHYTMLRPLAFDYRKDAQTFHIADQYMFGPAFLVNPVLEPMYHHQGLDISEQSVKTRSVYLPAGNGWYDFWSGAYYEGGKTIAANAALEQLPLFVPAGSIIPCGPERQYASEHPDAAIELLVYTGKDGSFVLYEDEGDNYGYEQGQFATIAIQWDDANRSLTLAARAGSYHGMKLSRTYRIGLIEAGIGFDLEHAISDNQTVEYDGTAMTIQF